MGLALRANLLAPDAHDYELTRNWARLSRGIEIKESVNVTPSSRASAVFGQKVLAFGYRESRITATEGTDGTHHIVLNDVGTTSIGQVGQIFTERRDSSMLTFPCFEVYARFAAGMSGGLTLTRTATSADWSVLA